MQFWFAIIHPCRWSIAGYTRRWYRQKDRPSWSYNLPSGRYYPSPLTYLTLCRKRFPSQEATWYSRHHSSSFLYIWWQDTCYWPIWRNRVLCYWQCPLRCLPSSGICCHPGHRLTAGKQSRGSLLFSAFHTSGYRQHWIPHLLYGCIPWTSGHWTCGIATCTSGDPTGLRPECLSLFEGSRPGLNWT